MLKHYLIIVYRNLLKNKLVSFVKIFGLAIGLATFILGVRYVQFEKSYDTHHSKYDRIYRVQTQLKEDKMRGGTQCCVPMARHLTENVAGVKRAAMFNTFSQYISTEDDRVFFNDKGALVDTGFFEIFDFNFIEGQPSTALHDGNTILLSESFAKKIFPDGDAMDKILLSEKRKEYVVRGIYADVPPNSNFEMEFMVPFRPYNQHDYTNWGNFSYNCLALLEPGANVEKINSEIRYLLDDHIRYNKSLFYLHPLAKLHLEPELSGDLLEVLYLTFSTILLILLLSAMNYMNLSTAYSSVRSKEIGVRKVSGGGANKLRVQYLFESVFYAISAFVLALVLAKLAAQPFNQVINREIEIQYFANPQLFVIVFLVAVFTGILSGLYPAFILSSFKPAIVLKGFNPFGNGKQKSYGLKGMVCFQFVLSTLLIAGCFWIFRNVEFLRNKDLGFDKDNLVHCEIPGSPNTNTTYNGLKNRIESHPAIDQMCISINAPIIERWGTTIFYEGQNAEDHIFARPNRVTKDFIETYDIDLLKGRNFNEGFPDANVCIINKTAWKQSGWTDDPIGKWIHIWGEKRRVIGVMEDIIFEDVHNPIAPYILFPHDGNLNSGNHYTFKVNPNQLASGMEHIRTTFREAFPQVVFDVYKYQDAMDDEAIEIWTSVRNTTVFFTVIAVVIAGFGLLALIVFSVQKRIKEIGVRKVQGAKIFSIYGLVIQEFLVLFTIATLICLPLPEIMIRTMPGVHKYNMQPWDYVIICGFSLLVVLISGSYNALKVSRMNPVEALRYE